MTALETTPRRNRSSFTPTNGSGTQRQRSDDTMESREYSDGFGRLIQKRTQADDLCSAPTATSRPARRRQPLPGQAGGPAIGQRRRTASWSAAGRSHDNKGQVIERYESFFATGWAWQPETEARQGQRIAIYDPRGQLVRTVNPDGSEQRHLRLPNRPDQPEPWRRLLGRSTATTATTSRQSASTRTDGRTACRAPSRARPSAPLHPGHHHARCPRPRRLPHRAQRRIPPSTGSSPAPRTTGAATCSPSRTPSAAPPSSTPMTSRTATAVASIDAGRRTSVLDAAATSSSSATTRGAIPPPVRASAV